MEIICQGIKIKISLDNPIIGSGYFSMIDHVKETGLDPDFIQYLECGGDPAEAFVEHAMKYGLVDVARQIYQELFQLGTEGVNYALMASLFSLSEVPGRIVPEIYRDTVEDLSVIVEREYFSCFTDFMSKTNLPVTQITDIVAEKIKIEKLDHYLTFLNELHFFVRSCALGRLDLVQCFVSRGVDVRAGAGNDLAVIVASRGGHLDVVKYLVSQGANACNFDAVCSASRNGHLEVVRYLVSKGADIRARNDLAVIWASECGRLEVVQYLVSQGGDIRACDDHAVKCASRHGSLDAVQYLVSLGADISAQDNCAVRLASSRGHLHVVQYLVSLGADISALDNCAVRLASTHGHLHVVQFLVSQGADIGALDNHAIIRASENGHLHVVQYLVSQGADVRAQNDRAVKSALQNGHNEIVEYLVSQGAKLDNQ